MSSQRLGFAYGDRTSRGGRRERDVRGTGGARRDDTAPDQKGVVKRPRRADQAFSHAQCCKIPGNAIRAWTRRSGRLSLTVLGIRWRVLSSSVDNHINICSFLEEL